MVHNLTFRYSTALALCSALPKVLAHGHDTLADPGLAPNVTSGPADMKAFHSSPQSYFIYPDYSNLMLAHIALMTIAWLFVLPIGERSLLIAKRATDNYQVLCLALRGHV